MEHGVEVYLCDNQSTDRTVEIAARWLGAGVRDIEHIPHDGTYRWRRILERKAELAAELEADWFLHLDPDEVPLPPGPGQTLADALAEVDAEGHNAVEFSEFTFVPSREAPDHDHSDYRRTMRWYYPYAPNQRLLRAWKRQPGPVDLAATGGHFVDFPGRRIAPRRFRLCHYLFLSREHAARKYGARRFDVDEVSGGWHGWRHGFDSHNLRLPAQDELRTLSAEGLLDPSSPRDEHCVVWGQP